MISGLFIPSTQPEIDGGDSTTNSANSHSSSPSISVAAPSLTASSIGPAAASTLPPSLHLAPSPNIVVDSDAASNAATTTTTITNIPGSPSSPSGLPTANRHHVTQNTTGFIFFCKISTLKFNVNMYTFTGIIKAVKLSTHVISSIYNVKRVYFSRRWLLSMCSGFMRSGYRFGRIHTSPWGIRLGTIRTRSSEFLQFIMRSSRLEFISLV